MIWRILDSFRPGESSPTMATNIFEKPTDTSVKIQSESSQLLDRLKSVLLLDNQLELDHSAQENQKRDESVEPSATIDPLLVNEFRRRCHNELMNLIGPPPRCPASIVKDSSKSTTFEYCENDCVSRSATFICASLD